MLNKKRVGCAVILAKNNSNVVGIVSERDLISNYKRVLDYHNIKISQIMIKDVISCNSRINLKRVNDNDDKI